MNTGHGGLSVHLTVHGSLVGQNMARARRCLEQTLRVPSDLADEVVGPEEGFLSRPAQQEHPSRGRVSFLSFDWLTLMMVELAPSARIASS